MAIRNFLVLKLKSDDPQYIMDNLPRSTQEFILKHFNEWRDIRRDRERFRQRKIAEDDYIDKLKKKEKFNG